MQALQALINDKEKLIAAQHRVVQCFEDRISVALFTENSNYLPLYQRIGTQLEVYRKTGEEFSKECLKSTQAYK